MDQIRVFAAWPGEETASGVIRAMVSLTRYGFRQIKIEAAREAYQGEYHGLSVYAVILDEGAPDRLLKALRLAEDQIVFVKEVLSDKVLQWSDNEARIGRLRTEKQCQSVAGQILGVALRRHTASLETPVPDLPQSLRGRGGGVVYFHLFHTGRIVTKPETVSRLEGNRVFHSLTGFKTPVVYYSTSDASNVFEFLQTLKAATWAGLPAVFSTYESAHTVGDYWERILTPSLALLGTTLSPQALGLNPAAKFTEGINSQKVMGAFAQAGFKVAPLVGRLAQEGKTFAGWYRIGLKYLADNVLGLLGLNVPFRLIAKEALHRHSPYWGMSLPDFAERLQRQAGHSVGIAHLPSGNLVRTDQDLPAWTIAKLHQKGGWLSGAGIVALEYQLGKEGGLLYIVKDSSAGLFHLLSRPYLEDSKSGLHLLPVGLFRLTAREQNEDWSVDPWVFLELLERWDERKAREVIGTIWETIEVPLDLSHIGRKTVVTVDLNGVEIKVRDASA